MAAREHSAAALGERAVALVGSSHNVVFTGDLHLGAERAGDDVLLLARALESMRPRCERRPMPQMPPPEPHADRIDRDALVADLSATLGAGGCVNVLGAEGIGKSYVLRASVAKAGRPDGIVWIEGEGRAAGDVLQGVFEELYDAHPTVASPEQRRRCFAGVRALVVVDGADAAAAEAERLRTELPDSAVVLATRTPAEWSEPAGRVGISGLQGDDALAVIARGLGGLDEDARPAAGRLVELLGGNPRRLRQAAGLVRRLGIPLSGLAAGLESGPEHELRRLLLTALGPEDRALLETLAGACGATLAVERLRAITGIPDAAARLQRLEREGLVQSGSPRYRLAGVLTGLEAAGSRERVAAQLAAFAAGQATAGPALLDELPAALALLRWARRERRDDISIALGRAFGPAALYGRRWDAWSLILRQVDGAARRSGDASARAWALHHLGTRAFALGGAGPSVAPLREALELRNRLGEHEAAAATRHNLEFVLGPPPPPSQVDDEPPPPRPPGRRGRWLAVGAVALALLAAGGAALAGRGDEPDPRDDTTRPTITIRVPEHRAEYVAGTAIKASFACHDTQLERCKATVDGRGIRNGDPLPLTAGSHELRVVATDAAGHRRVRSARYQATGDPSSGGSVEVTITQPEEREYAPGELPPADFACSGDTALQCEASITREGGVTAPIGDGDKLPAGPGAYTLVVVARSAGQEVGALERAFTVAGPRATLTVSIAQPIEGTRIVVGGTACASTCKVSVDAGPLTLEAQAQTAGSDTWALTSAGWDGQCELTEDGSRCGVTIDGDRTLTVSAIKPLSG